MVCVLTLYLINIALFDKFLALKDMKYTIVQANLDCLQNCSIRQNYF